MQYMHALVSIFIAQMIGVVGSVFTARSVNSWYAALNHPSWIPPNWVFGPVWITLYTIIGYSAFLIWEKRKVDTRSTFALWVYGVHLLFNGAWSIIFFGLQNPRLAFFEILVLDSLIIAVTILFWRISKSSGLLMLPYMAWSFFATYLNYTLWMYN